MFDFAFSELAVILLGAIIVIGPERLPKVARTAGYLWGRMQRSVRSVKNGIANDMAIEDARQLQQQYPSGSRCRAIHARGRADTGTADIAGMLQKTTCRIR